MSKPTLLGRRVSSFDEIEEPGDYALGAIVEEGETKPFIWFLLPIHKGIDKFDRSTPGSEIHGISSPPWTFRECLDGSIEVRASIACGRGSKDGEYWHGYLDEGHVWRDA